MSANKDNYNVKKETKIEDLTNTNTDIEEIDTEFKFD